MTNFKNFRLFASLAVILGGFILSVMITGCEKESLNTQVTPTHSQDDLNFRDGNGDGDVDASEALAILNGIPYGEISRDDETGALKFANGEAITTTINTLESAQNAFLSEIASSVAGLDEAIVDGMDINENLIFETFEENVGFTNSMRAEVDGLMNTFLSADQPDENADPSDAYAYAGPNYFQALINTLGEVRVGETISKVTADGGNYTIEDGDLSTLEFLRSNPSYEEIIQRANITVNDEPSSARGGATCRTYHANHATKYVNVGSKKYRAKATVKIRNFSFLWWNIHRVESDLESRRKVGWFWKKDYTTISINMSGAVYQSDIVAYPCQKIWYYDSLGNPVYYWDICYAEIPCGGERFSVSQSGSTYNHEYSRTQNYSFKIGASNQDGPAYDVTGTFNWRGLTFSVSVP